MMTPEQKATYERLSRLHAERKLKKQQAPLLANLARMAEQDKLVEAFEQRVKEQDETK